MEDLKISGFLYIKQDLSLCLSVSASSLIIILSCEVFFVVVVFFYTSSSLGQIKFIYVH